MDKFLSVLGFLVLSGLALPVTAHASAGTCNVPEPVSTALFLSGGAAMFGRFLNRKNQKTTK